MYSCFNYNQPSNQRHGEKIQLKTIQDQHFSNEILFFGLLGTIESIVIHYQGKDQQSHKKLLKAFDLVKYSSRNINQLRSQLQYQILLFRASRKNFLTENAKVGCQLPKNYNQYQANAFLQNAQKVFQQYQDEVSHRLTEDIRRLLWDQLDGLYSEKANLKVTNTEEERKGYKKNTFTNGVFASQRMDKRDAEIKDCKDRNELPVKINHPYNPFIQSNNVTASKIQQSSEKRQNNEPKNEFSYGRSTPLKLSSKTSQIREFS